MNTEYYVASPLARAYYQALSRVLDFNLKGYIRGISSVYQGNFKGKSRVYQGHIKGISRVYQGYIKGISRVYQG